ncbi:HalOD1 output domain-containing protein [Haladaptatus sp. NG-SE-30]
MSKSEPETWRTGTNRSTYHTQHDWTTTEPLSTTVMTAVADAMGEDPAEIGPLYERFDPDALDGLFSPRPDGAPRTGGHVAFTFEGYHVFIQSDGHIAIHPPAERT